MSSIIGAVLIFKFFVFHVLRLYGLARFLTLRQSLVVSTNGVVMVYVVFMYGSSFVVTVVRHSLVVFTQTVP
jgi:hypothetical protein